MYETPSRTNLRAGQRRPPALHPPSVGSMTAGGDFFSPAPGYASPTVSATPQAGWTPGYNSGSPMAQTAPQTPQQRLILRKPVSMQSLSTVRSHARLMNTPRTTTSAGAGEVYRGKIHVGVRVKPVPQEVPLPAWLVNPNTNVIEHESAGEFQFDQVYDGTADNAQVFEDSVEPLVAQVVDGYNATVFAYGTTGSGKTYTMQGLAHDPGVIPKSVHRLFELLEMRSQSTSVLLSYFEIYNERVFDLLADNHHPTEVRLRDSSTTGSVLDGKAVDTKVVGQREIEVHSAAELLQYVANGDTSRRTHSTQYNEHSSRSHAVVRIQLLNPSPHSVLYLCDLAGSERALQDSERRKEGSFINKSLLTLSTVISILSQGGGGHVPYRDSKLTRLLQPSLSGTALVAVLCTVQLNQTSSSNAETLNSLRFAAKAKNIVVTAKRNSVFEEPSLVTSNAVRIAEQYMIECENLKRELIKLRAERDDLQDKLSILETSENPDAERSLEAMTGINFGSEGSGDSTAALKKRIKDSESEIQSLRRQNQHLLDEFTSLNEVVTKLETESSEGSSRSRTASPRGPSSATFGGDVVLRDQVAELQEQLKDRDLLIALLTSIRDETTKLDQFNIDALSSSHGSHTSASNTTTSYPSSAATSEAAIQDLHI